ncbi:hypothetical protein [Sporohalobacter salinus]|uniref:hypothetical protein n=1 Tax=Sporohalobacter salinus TaxID=1494606 RepID=UPI0019622012|nr:hypothetical protein [Sporohalobacter salinus]MBM7623718.1 PHP family Zn ribbon phosphoesterase [Sporohalobacter salinus]
MSNKRLTKADILRSTDDVTYEYFEKLDGEIPLRPLSDGEAQKVENKQFENLDIDINPKTLEGATKEEIMSKVTANVDLNEFLGDDYEANCLACKLGIAFEEEMTIKEVKALGPPGIVGDIANRIYEISGMEGAGVEETLKSFRGDEKG